MPSFLRILRIRRISFALAFSVAVAAGLTGVVMASSNVIRGSIEDEAELGAVRTAETFARLTLEPDEFERDRPTEEALEDLHEKMPAVGAVEALAVYDRAGHALVRRGPDAGARRRNAAELFASPRTVTHIHGSRLEVVVPVRSAPDRPVAVAVVAQLPYGPVRAEISQRTRRYMTIVVILIVLLYLLMLPAVLRASRALDASYRQRDARRHAELRRALRDRRFELHYQPIHRVDDGEVAAYEALVRMRDTDGTLVPPLEFIPFAETSGLIHEIGAWVIDEACRQVRAWEDDGHEIHVCVNVSPRQLQDPGLPDLLAAALRRHRVPGDRLTVEVTETALRIELCHVREILSRLAALGVEVALDDFGADYSSLARLRELPLGAIKLDRSFLVGVPGDERPASLVTAILGLASALGVRTVLEGVETPEQWEFAGEAGADYVQGFLLGRPQPPAVAVSARHLVPGP